MSDGSSFNDYGVNAAIERYIDDWFAGAIEDPVLTRRIDEDRERKEREAQRSAGGRMWKHG